MVAKGEEDRERMDWEFGVSRCKPLHIEWINKKVLLYSTGNYIQYPVINHNGKESKESIYMYVKLNHFVLQKKLTQHCKSTILQLKKKNKIFLFLLIWKIFSTIANEWVQHNSLL